MNILCYALELLLSIAIWTTFYFIVRLVANKRQPEYWSRVLALTHGVLMAVLGTNECFHGEVSPIFRPDDESTGLENVILLISAGYFYVDLIWCLYHKTETKLMLCHHICSCVALTRIHMKRTSGGQTACSLGALEMTNPLLQARWFIRTYGYQKTPFFYAVEITFIVTFVIIRVILGTMYFYIILFKADNSIDYLIFAICLYIMSLMFLYNIVFYVKHKYLTSPITSVQVSHESENSGPDALRNISLNVRN